MKTKFTHDKKFSAWKKVVRKFITRNNLKTSLIYKLSNYKLGNALGTTGNNSNCLHWRNTKHFCLNKKQVKSGKTLRSGYDRKLLVYGNGSCWRASRKGTGKPNIKYREFFFFFFIWMKCVHSSILGHLIRLNC